MNIPKWQYFLYSQIVAIIILTHQTVNIVCLWSSCDNKYKYSLGTDFWRILQIIITKGVRYVWTLVYNIIRWTKYAGEELSSVPFSFFTSRSYVLTLLLTRSSSILLLYLCNSNIKLFTVFCVNVYPLLLVILATLNYFPMIWFPSSSQKMKTKQCSIPIFICLLHYIKIIIWT